MSSSTDQPPTPPVSQPKNPRCKNCGKVGDRQFVRAADGEWRDALGGEKGITLESISCGRCGGEDFDLVVQPQEVEGPRCGGSGEINTFQRAMEGQRGGDPCPGCKDCFGRCPVCGTSVRLATDGSVVRHRAAEQLAGVCSGTGRKPVACSTCDDQRVVPDPGDQLNGAPCPDCKPEFVEKPGSAPQEIDPGAASTSTSEEDSYYLCFGCEEIFPEGKATYWMRDYEGKYGVEGAVIPNPPDEQDPLLKCPKCGELHGDGHQGAGLEEGTLAECEAAKSEFLAPTPEQPEEPTCGGSGYLRVEGAPVPGHGHIGVPESEPCPGCKDCSTQEAGGDKRPTIQEAAELALREIDGMFKYFLVSGLSEEGGGLPLYEQSKGLADARAQLAASLAQEAGGEEGLETLPEKVKRLERDKKTLKGLLVEVRGIRGPGGWMRPGHLDEDARVKKLLGFKSITRDDLAALVVAGTDRGDQLEAERDSRLTKEQCREKLNDPKSRRGWIYRTQVGDGWSSWKVAELGIPSLIAKGRDRDDYEVVEVLFAEDAHAAFGDDQ